jgi:hypothetical protein
MDKELYIVKNLRTIPVSGTISGYSFNLKPNQLVNNQSLTKAQAASLNGSKMVQAVLQPKPEDSKEEKAASSPTPSEPKAPAAETKVAPKAPAAETKVSPKVSEPTKE